MPSGKKKPIRLVIADDHAILRSGLRMLLNAQADMKVVGEGEDGVRALEQVRSCKPDVLLADITMPGGSGIEIIGEVKRLSPRTKVVMLTMHAEAAYLHSALAAGAVGYVLKRSLDSDLVSAIRSAHEGKTVIDSSVTAHLVQKALGPKSRYKTAPQQSFEMLSRRERQVFTLVAKGFTSEQIANRIFVGIKTVETYRARLLKKLRIKTRSEIVQFAIEAGLLAKTEDAL